MNDTVLRDGNGRFASGTAGGPGRKPRQTEREYLQTMERVIDSEAWEAIVRRALQDAIDGDPRARQWIASYLLGQPTQRIAAENDESMQLLGELLRSSGPLLPPRAELAEALRLEDSAE